MAYPPTWTVRLDHRHAGSIAPLTETFNEKLSFELNGIDSFTFSQYLDDPQAAIVLPLETVVRVFRDEHLMISADVGPRQRDAEAGTQTFTCFSPLKRCQS